MEQYEKDVVYAREHNIDQRFSNSIIEHAIILTKEIIIDANKKVSVLSDSFNEFFYFKLEDNIIKFLRKSKSNIFELIVIDKQKNNNLINKLKKEFPNQFKVKYISEDKFPIDNDTSKRVNYIVNDNNAFRYEYNDKYIQNGVVNAVVNFNHKEDSKILNDMFEEIKKK